MSEMKEMKMVSLRLTEDSLSRIICSINERARLVKEKDCLVDNNDFSEVYHQLREKISEIDLYLSICLTQTVTVWNEDLYKKDFSEVESNGVAVS